MGLETFINLCDPLRKYEVVKNSFQSILEEQITKFLHIIGHNINNQSVSLFHSFFHQYEEIVFPHFHNVECNWRKNS